MDGHSSSGPVTVLLLTALTSSALGQGLLYFEVGKPLVLTPPKQGTAIKSVVWQFNGNLVAEWVNNNIEFFGSFKGRTELDKSTAQLTVNNAMQSDAGEYKVEINDVLQSQVWTVKVIKRVPTPKVEVTPLTCGPKSNKCTLTCQGDPAGTQPLTYSWRKDSGDWEPEQQSNDLIISNDEKTKLVEKILCRMKNPISELESTHFENPFFIRVMTVGQGIGIGVGAVAGVAAVAAAAFAVWKREAIKTKFCAESGPI